MAPSRALLDKAPASALACGLPLAASIPLPALNPSCFRRHSSDPVSRIRAVSSYQSSASLELIRAVSSQQQMAERKRTDMDEPSRDSFSELASMLVAGASFFWRHSSAPLGLLWADSSHQQMAELKRTDVDETSLRDSFSQLASMLVAGVCAAAAFGCSTPHSVAAYAAEGVAEESSTIFQRSCAGCHAGGGNILQPNATLFAKDLDRNGMANSDGIFQITYFGKGRMPGYGEKCTPRGQCTFGPRLSDSDIRSLAEFVRVQADQGWSAK